MKKSVLFYVSALLISALMFSCTASDEKVQKEVNTALTAVNTNVNASVKDRVVTLTGVVESEESKMAAETAVRSVKDVKSVMNNIEVKAPVVVNPDNEMTTKINAALAVGGFQDVKVSVNNGVVTLTGDVKRADLQKVMQIANEAQPRQVENKLNIKR